MRTNILNVEEVKVTRLQHLMLEMMSSEAYCQFSRGVWAEQEAVYRKWRRRPAEA